MKGDLRCIEGRLFRHDPQWDDPDLETDVGQCPDCSGHGCGDHPREILARWMISMSIPTGHGDSFDDLLGELAGYVAGLRVSHTRLKSDRDDHDRALRDAIRETAATADELAFWRYQAIWGRAYLLQPSAIKTPFMEEGAVWKEAERQLEAARVEGNRERYAHAEAPRDPTAT